MTFPAVSLHLADFPLPRRNYGRVTTATTAIYDGIDGYCNYNNNQIVAIVHHSPEWMTKLPPPDDCHLGPPAVGRFFSTTEGLDAEFPRRKPRKKEAMGSGNLRQAIDSLFVAKSARSFAGERLWRSDNDGRKT